MKDIGDKTKNAEEKKYKEQSYAGETLKTDYLKYTDGKAERDAKKVKRSMIKE